MAGPVPSESCRKLGPSNDGVVLASSISGLPPYDAKRFANSIVAM